MAEVKQEMLRRARLEVTSRGKILTRVPKWDVYFPAWLRWINVAALGLQ